MWLAELSVDLHLNLWSLGGLSTDTNITRHSDIEAIKGAKTSDKIWEGCLYHDCYCRFLKNHTEWVPFLVCQILKRFRIQDNLKQSGQNQLVFFIS